MKTLRNIFNDIYDSSVYTVFMLILVIGSILFLAVALDRHYKEKVIVQLPCGQRLVNVYNFSRTDIKTTRMSSDYQPNVFISKEANGFNYIEVRECR